MFSEKICSDKLPRIVDSFCQGYFNERFIFSYQLPLDLQCKDLIGVNTIDT